jgi:type I restriction enzyme, S subunit
LEREREVLEKLNLSYTSLIEKTLINKNSPKLFFSDLLKVIRGVGYKPDQLLDNYYEKTCIILRSNNISDSVINYVDVKILSSDLIKKGQQLIEGDFAICMSNGSKELVGKAAEYIDQGKNVSIGSFCAGLRPFTKEKKLLLKHLLNSESYRYAIKRILTGSAINNLKPSDIEGLFLRVDSHQIKNGILYKLEFMYENKGILGSQSLQKSLINQIF